MSPYLCVSFCESKWIKGHLGSSTIVSLDGTFELLLASGAGRNRGRDVVVELQAEVRLEEGETGIARQRIDCEWLRQSETKSVRSRNGGEASHQRVPSQNPYIFCRSSRRLRIRARLPALCQEPELANLGGIVIPPTTSKKYVRLDLVYSTQEYLDQDRVRYYLKRKRLPAIHLDLIRGKYYIPHRSE